MWWPGGCGHSPAGARLMRAVVVVLVAALALAGCGDDDSAGDAAAPTTAESTTSTDATTSTTAPPEALRILLVNDDGMSNPAIDVMLGLLSADPSLEVTVVAPSEERSGSSDATTDGGAAYEPATTPAGADGYAVHGFPADAVAVGLDDLGLDPHLVLSGVNPGQNVGPLAAVSGTVGVGRTAIRRGVPALAVSAALELDDEQFRFAAGLALDWIREHRDELLDRTAATDTVTSINVPDCPVPDMGPVQEVPLADSLPEGVNVFESSCDLSDPAPATDVAALVVGYPTMTRVPPDL